MSRARPLAPDDRRAQLLDAARRVFAQRGYHGASVTDILEAAAVARGTFYNYFGSKRDAFDAVLGALIDEVADAIQPIDVGRPLALQVEANLERVVGVLTSGGDLARVLFVDAAGIDAEGRETLIAFYDAATARVVRALRTGQAMGVVAEGDVEVLAACLIGMLKEPIFQSVLRHEPLDAAAIASTILRVTTAGVVRFGPG